MLEQEPPRFQAALITNGLAYLYRNHEVFAVLQTTETLRSDSELLAIGNLMAAAPALQAAATEALAVLENVSGPKVADVMQHLSAALVAAASKRDPQAVPIQLSPDVTEETTPRLPEEVWDFLLDLLDSRHLPEVQKHRLREIVHGAQ